jgi:hypothetical protein
MLEYFKTSSALRSVQFEVEEDVDEPYYMNDFLPSLEGHILLALAQNANVRKFVGATGLPQREFLHYLTSNTTAIRTCRLERFDFRDAAKVACAFEANQSIRRLFMTCGQGSGELVECILRQLDARCRSAGPTGFDVKVTVEIPYRYAAFGATLINKLAHSEVSCPTRT